MRVPPYPVLSEKLTGRRRFRAAGDNLVLQVEIEASRGTDYACSSVAVEWRDASIKDLSVHDSTDLPLRRGSS